MHDKIIPEIITDQNTAYSLSDLCRISGRDNEWISSLIDYEVIFSDMNGNLFSYHQLHITLKALRLQSDLELNTAGVALALQLIETIELQEKEIQRLKHLG